jgi:lysozyme
MRNKGLVGAALAAALTLLTVLEGVEHTAYPDSGGVWTICSGSTKGVRPGHTATERECYEMTMRDYRDHEDAVLRGVTVHQTDNQLTALTLFCYNVGKTACARSTLFKRINAGQCAELRSEFLRWNKVQGKPVRGLTNRRVAEADLYLKDCK